jgi:hypothetical protein
MSEKVSDQLEQQTAEMFEGEQLQLYAEAIGRADEIIGMALGDVEIPSDKLRIPPLESYNRKYADILSASLDTPLASRTLDTWTRMLNVPRVRGSVDQNYECGRAWDSAANAIGRVDVTTKLIDMYRANEDNATGDQILSLFIMKEARDSWGFTSVTPEYSDLMQTALPKEIARRAEAIRLNREANAETMDADLTADEQAQLYFAAEALSKLMAAHPAPDIDGLMAQLTDLWHQEDSKAAMDYVWDAVLDDFFARERVLKHWGLDVEELADVWDKAYSQDKLPDGSPMPGSPTHSEYIRENLQTIRELEYRDAGSAAGLRRLNRIRNFARYDVDVLHDMYQRRFTHHEHNVLYATAVADHNGAFYKSRLFKKEQYDELVAAGIGVHFVEFDGENELKEMTASWLTYRPGELFDLIVASGHSNGYSITAREATARRLPQAIGTWAILGNVGNMMRKVGDANTIHLYNSCSTGIDKSAIGGVTNAETGRRVLAPEEPAGIMSLRIEHQNGRITNVEVIYTHRYDAGNNTWGGRPVNTVEFNGPVTGKGVLVVPLEHI